MEKEVYPCHGAVESYYVTPKEETMATRDNETDRTTHMQKECGVWAISREGLSKYSHGIEQLTDEEMQVMVLPPLTPVMSLQDR